MKNILFIVVISLFSASAMAEGIGFNLYAKAGKLTISDPDGDTDSPTSIVPGARLSYGLSTRGSRVFLGFEALSEDVDPDTDKIGQEISGSNFYGGYEKRFPISRDFKLWLGGSLNYVNQDYENRFTVDDDGFLADSYNDRSSSYAGVSLFADTYLHVSERWVIGLGLFSDFALGEDGTNHYGLRLSFGRE